MLQAALLRHGLLFLLGPHNLLCVQRLRRSGDVLRSPAFLLHGFGLVLLGSGDLLLGPGFVLLCTGCHVLCSAGKLLHASRYVLRGSRRKLLRSLGLIWAIWQQRSRIETIQSDRAPGFGRPGHFLHQGRVDFSPRLIC